MNTYGFKIGSHIYNSRGASEKNALINLIKQKWSEIDKYENIELYGLVSYMNETGFQGRDK